jgi:hypothetical protein
MPSSNLKRAERAIQTIRDQAELPPETADALQELSTSSGTSRAVCRRWKAKESPSQRRRQIGNNNEQKKRHFAPVPESRFLRRVFLSHQPISHFRDAKLIGRIASLAIMSARREA